LPKFFSDSFDEEFPPQDDQQVRNFMNVVRSNLPAVQAGGQEKARAVNNIRNIAESSENYFRRSMVTSPAQNALRFQLRQVSVVPIVQLVRPLACELEQLVQFS
jgi:hypothetical protein